MAIQSFADKDAEAFSANEAVRKTVGWTQIRGVVRRKLDMVHYAVRLSDLSSPPGNGLEAFKHDLAGYYGIRINDQWRIAFRWTDAGPEEVAVVE